MGSWRVVLSVAVVAGVVVGTAVVGAGPWVALPPLVTATVVLIATALAVDYFGLRRRRAVWRGFGDDPRQAAYRARVLSARFGDMRRTGSPWTAAVGRSLLFALAECDRLADAGPVVDFLSADALFTRVGRDPTADAVRAMALADSGRVGEARALVASIGACTRSRDHAIVDYVTAFVDDLDGRPRAALARIAAAADRERLDEAARRDLLLLRVRILIRTSRIEEAADTLRSLCDRGWRRRVELLGESARTRGDAATSVAVSHALAVASPYR